MEVRDLRVLVTCLELGSMTRAAERLHLVQPAVSQAVARLERESGVALLERHHGGVRATEAGHVLAGHARLILAAIGRAGDEMEAFRGMHRGTVRIGMLHTVTPLILVRLLRAVRQRHPGVRVRAEEDSIGKLVDGVVAGELDLAVVFLPAGSSAARHGLRVAELNPAELVVISAADARLPDGPEVALARLRDEPWISFGRGNPGRRWVDRSCAAAGFTPRIVAEVGTFAQLRGFVAAGIGLAVVPAPAVEAQQALGTVRVARIDPRADARLGYLHRNTRDTPAVSAVRQLIQREFGVPGASPSPGPVPAGVPLTPGARGRDEPAPDQPAPDQPAGATG